MENQKSKMESVCLTLGVPLEYLEMVIAEVEKLPISKTDMVIEAATAVEFKYTEDHCGKLIGLPLKKIEDLLSEVIFTSTP